MPITAGSISIVRRINTGDYSHKEAKAELHYTAEGGEDIDLLGAHAAHMALVQLAQVLATVVKIDHTPEIHVEAPPKPEDVASRGLDEVVETGRRRRRTKAEMQAGAVNLAGDTDPMTLFSDMQDAEPAVTVPKAAASDASWDDDEVTDKALNNACNETMLRIKNKAKIQAVISEYTQGAVSTIPQSSRAAFMQKLQALQP